MKVLHTADWHVGKTVRGRSRAAEHEAVLAEVVAVADTEDVDLVLVVGDLFDTAAPTPESERIVYRALLDLARGGRPVVVVAGNHDNPRRLAAVAPVFAPGSVHVATTVARPDDGGVLTLAVGDVPVRLALLPFLSQRHVIGADELMAGEAAEHAQGYDDRVRRIVAALCRSFGEPVDGRPAVNLVVAHAHVAGGVVGGGERSAHTIFEYAVSPLAFPPTAHYVALGHLHRTQRVDGPCPTWYPGSPLQMDAGEAADVKHVLVIDVEPGAPAQVRPLALTAGRRFRTVAGTLDELAAQVIEGSDDLVRVVVREASRVGLADEVRALFPDAIDIRVEAPGEATDQRDDVGGPDGRGPGELFAAYLAERGVADDRLTALFAGLLDEASEADRVGGGADAA